MAAAKKRKGRWSAPMGELHILLARAFPKRRTQSYAVLDVAWLAKKLKVTDEGVYTWLRENKLPYKRAQAICEIEECTIDIKKLMPFVK